jgi:hypothetical protein
MVDLDYWQDRSFVACVGRIWTHVSSTPHSIHLIRPKAEKIFIVEG